ncbi:helix-turn-helix domain-containing protein [Flavobacterium sp.]|uniref:helix-turn-helix domain-containing protein n=1 Tax=Flavobacterium sp. TaxID=239 RepID=UPI0011FE4DFD|nr:helix-turn-helix domain-containing protein [Flavobacterium sp.]RZJ73585.1 MAG: XRE family transcriptional regulator [Flavobacterium sp.]
MYFKDKRFVAFGKHVQELRRERGVEIKDIVANTTLSVKDVTAIELGAKNFGFSTLLELAKGLEVTPSQLLDMDFQV